MDIAWSADEWWSRTLEPELGIIRVHAIPAPKDAPDFERQLGLAIAAPGQPEDLVERVKALADEHGYSSEAILEGGTEPIWIVTLRK